MRRCKSWAYRIFFCETIQLSKGLFCQFFPELQMPPHSWIRGCWRSVAALLTSDLVLGKKARWHVPIFSWQHHSKLQNWTISSLIFFITTMFTVAFHSCYLHLLAATMCENSVIGFVTSFPLTIGQQANWGDFWFKKAIHIPQSCRIKIWTSVSLNSKVFSQRD